jgi:hypothetical protein
VWSDLEEPARLALIGELGLNELRLIVDVKFRAWPPRLPEQPIFYPVLNVEYARQIARDWNTKDEPYAGFVTRFNVGDDYGSALRSKPPARACTKSSGCPPKSSTAGALDLRIRSTI